MHGTICVFARNNIMPPRQRRTPVPPSRRRPLRGSRVTIRRGSRHVLPPTVRPAGVFRVDNDNIILHKLTQKLTRERAYSLASRRADGGGESGTKMLRGSYTVPFPSAVRTHNTRFMTIIVKTNSTDCTIFKTLVEWTCTILFSCCTLVRYQISDYDDFLVAV